MSTCRSVSLIGLLRQSRRVFNRSNCLMTSTNAPATSTIAKRHLQTTLPSTMNANDLDIGSLRRQTPCCYLGKWDGHESTLNAVASVITSNVDPPDIAHYLHFNAAGSSPPVKSVIDRQEEHMHLEALVGGYAAQDIHSEQYRKVYSSIATLISCEETEIALMESATCAYNKAIGSISLNKGDRVLLCAAEYAGNFVALSQLCQTHQALAPEVIPSGSDGAIDLEHLEASLKKGGVKMVSLTHIPTNSGLINPAVEVGALCKQYGATYVLDACQSVGQIPINVKEINCDFLSATGRKFLAGPRGTGFLFAKDGGNSSTPPLLDHWGAPISNDLTRPSFEIHAHARRYEWWEASIACRLGLGAAVDHVLDVGVVALAERYKYTGHYLRTHLAQIEGVTIRDSLSSSHGSSIVSFDVEGVPSAKITAALIKLGVFVATSEATSSPLDDRKECAPHAVVRASPASFISDAELDKFVQMVKYVVEPNRNSV